MMMGALTNGFVFYLSFSPINCLSFFISTPSSICHVSAWSNLRLISGSVLPLVRRIKASPRRRPPQHAREGRSKDNMSLLVLPTALPKPYHVTFAHCNSTCHSMYLFLLLPFAHSSCNIKASGSIVASCFWLWLCHAVGLIECTPKLFLAIAQWTICNNVEKLTCTYLTIMFVCQNTTFFFLRSYVPYLAKNRCDVPLPRPP